MTADNAEKQEGIFSMFRYPLDSNAFEKVREMAFLFLDLPIEHDENFPFIVHHPFYENDPDIINSLFRSSNVHNDYPDYQSFYANKIHRASELFDIYFLLRKPYWLAFTKAIIDVLPINTFSELLGFMWTEIENPNGDINVSVTELCKWFKRAKKHILMNEEDYEVFCNFPNEFQVFRGVSVGRNPKGLSWTRNIDEAEWFAHRFDTSEQKGYIQSAIIDKSQVFAYFNTRKEEEVVVKPKASQISILNN